MERLFDLDRKLIFYTRLATHNDDAKKIADLEGGACDAYLSGQAASFIDIQHLLEENIISSAAIYGGTFNLIAVTMKKWALNVPCQPRLPKGT